MRFTTTLVLAAALAGVTFAGASGEERIDAAAIAKKGAGAGVPACESCHSGVGQFPLLNGQVELYLARQLVDFRRGYRASETMAPIAKALTDNQILALAKYFSELPRKKA
ncbi:MAG: hypothetical protein K2X44_07325, partial [Magnetospirillum sp.]|nr:hypothetical protein [Magnetospirillum sp.]